MKTKPKIPRALRETRDPIVEDVRKCRMAHTRKCGGDLAVICEDLRSVQSASGHAVVRLAPKKTGETKSSRQRKEDFRVFQEIRQRTKAISKARLASDIDRAIKAIRKGRATRNS